MKNILSDAEYYCLNDCTPFYAQEDTITVYFSSMDYIKDWTVPKYGWTFRNFPRTKDIAFIFKKTAVANTSHNYTRIKGGAIITREGTGV